MPCKDPVGWLKSEVMSYSVESHLDKGNLHSSHGFTICTELIN